jgi:hypothetical protein
MSNNMVLEQSMQELETQMHDAVGRGSRSAGKDTTMKRWQCVLLATLVGFGFSAIAANASVVGPYFQQNLVSDIPGLAPVTDPNLQNP